MKIRIATEADAGDVADIYAPAVLETPISFELEPPPPAEMARRIRETLPEFPWLVCELDDRVAGYAYAVRHRSRPAYQWAVDVSVYVRYGIHRAGVGRALYTGLFDLLRLQGFYQACAGIALPNPGSVGLHEAMGFKPIGVYRAIGFKFGKWHDTGWWQLELRVPDGSPAPPRRLEAIRESAEVAAALERASAPRR